MRFTRRSFRWRKHLERKKRLIEILGGVVAATHSTDEVPMRQAMQKVVVPTSSKPEPTRPRAADPNFARLAFKRRRLAREARP